MHTLKKTLIIFIIFSLYGTTITIAGTSDVSGKKAKAVRGDYESFITIQVSSFKTAKSAAKEVSNFKTRGVKAFSRHVVKGKKQWHVIYVGKFNTRQKAKKMALKLKSKRILSSGYLIKRIRIPKKKMPDIDVTSTTNIAKQEDLKGRGSYESFFTIQVSSFKTAKSSAKEVSNLKSRGLEAFFRYEAVKGKGQWYRVYIGKFNTEQKAKKIALKLKSQDILTSWYSIKKVRFQKVLTASPEHLRERMKETPSIDVKKSSKKVVSPPPVKDEKTINTQLLEIEPKQKYVNEKSRFSIAIKTGIRFSPDVGDFKVTRTTGSVVDLWTFNESSKLIAVSIVPSFRLTESFLLESEFEKAFATELDCWIFTFGPKVMLGSTKSFSPYLKGGIVYGLLAWDDMPGDFDNALGGNVGIGLNFQKKRYKLAIEAAYRYIRFDYNFPSVAGVSANHLRINFSGYLVSASLRF